MPGTVQDTLVSRQKNEAYVGHIRETGEPLMLKPSEFLFNLRLP